MHTGCACKTDQFRVYFAEITSATLQLPPKTPDAQDPIDALDGIGLSGC